MKPALVIIAVVGILAVLFAGFSLFVTTVPPRSLTHTHMHVMKRRILRHAAAHDSLPDSLDQMAPMEGFSNSLKDGWRRPILWRVNGDEVTLISFGRDGAPGGSGEDADMIANFRTKTAEGKWADELCEWEIDPYGRELKKPKGKM